MFFRLAALLLFIALPARSAAAQAAAAPDSGTVAAARNAPLFTASDVVHVTLTADWKAVLKERGEEPEYQEAFVEYETAGTAGSLAVRVRPRGDFRKDRSNCDFPPLRLNFKKEDVPGTLFAHQDKLKMVTHCQTGRSVYEQYVLLEYLAYRTYNQVTDYSFRVRLLRVTYRDPSGEAVGDPTVAFLIEDDDAVAARLEGVKLERDNILLPWLDPEHATLLPVFQYMIGNTDWEVPVRHNVRLMATAHHARPIAIPYDFDFAGIVDARYAAPDPKLGLKSVRDRMYRGHCQPLTALAPALTKFREKRDAIYALYTEVEWLDDRQRKRALEYFDAFYEVIERPRLAEAEMVRVCRQELGP